MKRLYNLTVSGLRKPEVIKTVEHALKYEDAYIHGRINELLEEIQRFETHMIRKAKYERIVALAIAGIIRETTANEATRDTEGSRAA